jgi:uncharacterized protein (TIGR00369 family)
MDVAAFLEGLPFVDLLGIEIPTVEAGHAVGTVAIRPELSWTDDEPRAHAGVTYTLAEATGAAAVLATADPPVYTVDARVDYLDVPHGDLRAVADAAREGDALGVVDVTVTDERETTVAVARAVYALQ